MNRSHALNGAGMVIQHSSKKINFRKIKLILDLENWHQKLKIAAFWRLSIKQSYTVSKNPLKMFTWMQKSIKFQRPHYEIPQLSSRYCTPTLYFPLVLSEVGHSCKAGNSYMINFKYKTYTAEFYELIKPILHCFMNSPESVCKHTFDKGTS